MIQNALEHVITRQKIVCIMYVCISETKLLDIIGKDMLSC